MQSISLNHFMKATFKSFLLLFIVFCGTEKLYAGGYNIAPSAKVSASTSLNSQFDARYVTDGLIRLNGMGEWACEGVTTSWGDVRYPWVQLDWNESHYIDRIVLYDRPDMKEHTAGGRLIFSDGSVVYVRQIPNNGTGKEVRFATKHVEWVRFEVTDGTGKDVGLSEFEVFAAPEEATDFVSMVDPYIETSRGRYLFFIPGNRPFGMVGAAPHTRNKNQNGGGYNYNEDHILGFGQIHNWMMAGIQIMPSKMSVNPSEGESAWKSYFTHQDEIVQPGYHRTYLHDPATWVEYTTSDRVSFYQFRFTEKGTSQLLTNLGGHLGNSDMTNAEVTKVDGRTFEGSISTVNRFWGGPKDVKVFFVATFDKPFDELNGWKAQQHLDDIAEIAGDSVGLSAVYHHNIGDVVKMKIAISYTSVENARNNMTEIEGWDFDGVKSESQEIWNEWLGNIQVEGGETDQRVKFYTDIWHGLLGRHRINDLSGDYPDRTKGQRDGTFTDAEFKVRTLPKDENGKVRYNIYNSDAFWLTQWNLNVLWGLGWPKMLDEMAASQLQYAQNGYMLPRGPSGGGYSYIMTGNPSSMLIVSAYMKGLLTKFDAEEAFEIVKRNQLPGGMLGSEEDIKFYEKNGYWKDNAGITIEAASQDWAVAQMALKLGKKRDYKRFANRAEGWKKLYNPDQSLLFPRDENGNFVHDNPLSGQGWIEANAWQGTWGISHGLFDLSTMMGGGEQMASKLNHAFEKAEPSDFVFAYNEGYVSYANQPGCSNAHVFNYAGQPWLTQYWVRKVRKQTYGGTTPDLGYGGHDEDQGQMGGVSALMSIGLFSIDGTVGATPVYEITSPIFDNVTISLDDEYYEGNSFQIITHNNSEEHMYIQKASLNGEPLNRFWITHEELAKGGTLEIWLGKEPNKSWGLADFDKLKAIKRNLNN